MIISAPIQPLVCRFFTSIIFHINMNTETPNIHYQYFLSDLDSDHYGSNPVDNKRLEQEVSVSNGPYTGMVYESIDHLLKVYQEYICKNIGVQCVDENNMR